MAAALAPAIAAETLGVFTGADFEESKVRDPGLRENWFLGSGSGNLTGSGP